MPTATVESGTTYALTARFPLGVYRGHLPDGTPERLPSFRRAFDALVAAAALGTEGLDSSGGRRTFSAESRRCLEWLAENPPTGVRIPRTASPRGGSAIAWRKEGVFRKEGKSVNYKVGSRDMHSGTAVAGDLAWCWDDMPEEVRLQLDLLAADVPYLGESESAVILSLTADASPTHRLALHATALRPVGVPVEVPAPGRLDALEANYGRAHPAKRPTAARDRHNLNAMPEPAVAPDHAATELRFYEAEHAPTSSATPWSSVVLVPLRCVGRPPADNELVSVAALAHRALVQRISAATFTGEVPSSVTGIYAEGASRPANHVAIHWIPSTTPALADVSATDHLAILIPSDEAEEALEAITAGLSGLRWIRSKQHEFEVDSTGVRLIPADSFWAPVPAGSQRWWRPSPVAIPERSIRVPGGSESDHAETAMHWSLGNVFRNDPVIGVADPAARRAELERRGVRVAAAAPVLTRRPLDYVHRTKRRSLVRPYSALVDLGGLVPPTTLLAVGQSRHLGGGLLVPVDLPLPEIRDVPEEP